MKKIVSLFMVLFLLVVSFALFTNHSRKSYTATPYYQSADPELRPLDNPKPPQKNPTGSKPTPKEPPKDQQRPPGGEHKGSGPDIPEPKDPPKTPDPCNCPHKAGVRTS